MEKNVKVSMLCQIYGKMLTEKQYQVINDYYNNDLSLSEIAENNNITRQAVRDIIKKGENKLFELEEKPTPASSRSPCHPSPVGSSSSSSSLLSSLVLPVLPLVPPPTQETTQTRMWWCSCPSATTRRRCATFSRATTSTCPRPAVLTSRRRPTTAGSTLPCARRVFARSLASQTRFT